MNLRCPCSFMSDYANDGLDIPCGVSQKVHIITAHLVTFLDKFKVGLGRFAEKTSEAVHAVFKPTEQIFCVNEKNPKHEKEWFYF